MPTTRYRPPTSAPGGKRASLATPEETRAAALAAAADWPLPADAPGVPGPCVGRTETGPRGAVPVGVETAPTGAPHDAQKCADAGTGWEQDGQGSVTGAC